MNVVLAEDQPLILESLKMLLDEDPDIHVTATAADGEEALEAIRTCRPDIAVLDIRMPQCSGLEVVRILNSEGRNLPVLLLTTFDEPEAIRGALNAGVEGFLLKDIEPSQFLMAVKAVSAGLIVYHPELRDHLRRGVFSGTIARRNYGLTERDLGIVEAIVQGLSNKEIADRDGCSEGTVKNRVSSILGKMDLSARTQIAVAALKENLL